MIVAVVGASGRLGAATVAHFREQLESVRTVAVSRTRSESPWGLAARSVEAGPQVVVNTAGAAHIERESDDSLSRLHVSNVELPSILARAALQSGAAFVHVSSTKAKEPSDSAYARSKYDGDQALIRTCAPAFDSAGLPIVIVRPPALLIPPIDAGRLRQLAPIRHVPTVLVPPVRLPVLEQATILEALRSLVVRAEQLPRGLSYRDFGATELGTLRSVRAAFASGT